MAPPPLLQAQPGAAGPVPTGVGLGLRWEFLEEVATEPVEGVAFFEVSPENYLGRGGYYPDRLERVRARHPLFSHGLTLSLGGTTPFRPEFLAELRREVRRLGAPWHSDHACFTAVGERVLHDLLPVRFSGASARRMAERMLRARDALGVPIALENISAYATLGAGELTEAAFLAEVLERADARLLLDVNNVFVNAQNHGFDAEAFLDALPLERVCELHVAGHTRRPDGLIIDTHAAPVLPAVVRLMQRVVERIGPVPVLLERDHDVPPLAELLAEVRALDGAYQAALGRRDARQGARAPAGVAAPGAGAPPAEAAHG